MDRQIHKYIYIVIYKVSKVINCKVTKASKMSRNNAAITFDYPNKNTVCIFYVNSF